VTTNGLPKHWQRKELQDISSITMGTSPPSNTYNSEQKGLPFFQGKAEFTALHPVPQKWCTVPERIAEANDILLSVRAPVGAVNIADRTCCIGRGLAAIRFENYKYLFYFLKSVANSLDEHATGTTFRAITAGVVKNTSVPLPPVEEQERIVAKIEELFSELDAGVESLKKAQAQLKTYRQSVLKHAFEGRLTNDNIKDGELPAGWKFIGFSEVATVKSNLVDPGQFPDSPHVAPDNIERETGRILDYNTIAEDKVTSPKHHFFKGQIIYSKIRPYLNKLIIAPFDGLCSADMYPIETILDTRFMFYSMLSQTFVEQSSTAGSRSVLPKINQRELSRIFMNVPPTLDEQQRVVAEIESRLSVCDKMEEAIEAGLKQAEALRQSILKKAFEGKLVPQIDSAEAASPKGT